MGKATIKIKKKLKSTAKSRRVLKCLAKIHRINNICPMVNSYQGFATTTDPNPVIQDAGSWNIFVHVQIDPPFASIGLMTIYLPTHPINNQVVFISIGKGTIHTLVFDTGGRPITQGSFTDIDNAPKNYITYAFIFNQPNNKWVLMG